MFLFEQLKQILPSKPWTFWDHLYWVACSVITTIIGCLVIGGLAFGSETISPSFEESYFTVFGLSLHYCATYWVFHGFPTSFIRWPIRIFWVVFTGLLLYALHFIPDQ